ncbi:MAG: hypothetical protein JWP74_2128 [Marmoricola sp.]|nr:hypothetical protein [Marmoricola sp.]
MDLVPAPSSSSLRPDGCFALDEPFTPAAAASAGIGRSALERLVRSGEVERLVRGVYVAAGTPLTTHARARALALVLGRRQVVVDRTAAWVHGAQALRLRPGGTGATRGTLPGPIPLDVASRRRRIAEALPLGRGDLTVVGGVRCTSAVRTALDVGRFLAPERALPLLDGMLRAGSLTHLELVDASDRAETAYGSVQLREMVAMADARAAGTAESVLRLHWYDASLPTPVPGLVVTGSRLALGLGLHRFGVALSGQLGEPDLAACAAVGWRVLVLDRCRVLRSDPLHVTAHLEREFHQHLLSQVG